MGEREDYSDAELPARPVSPFLVVVVTIGAVLGWCCGAPLLLLYLAWD